MVKCPFCGFANEDGALFCEQCKSDISNVAPAPSVPDWPPPTPMPESVPPAADAPVMAAIVEDAPITAEVVPIAPAEEEPIAAAIAEDEPVLPIKEEPAIAAAVVEEKPIPAASETAPQAPPDVSPFAAAVGAVASPTPPPSTAPAAKPAGGTPIPAGAQVKLVVQRGLKVGEEYSVFAGENYVGRADEKPVDIDLTFQEPEDRVWCSRQHALVVFDDAAGMLTIEDLNSSNGTYVNRERVYPGQPRQLFVGNTIQIGTVHLRVKV